MSGRRSSSFLLPICMAMLCAFATAARPRPVEQFFAGKQIKFVVGSAGGGGYEFYAGS